MSKLNRSIVGLTILALLAVGGIALAGGFGAGNSESRVSCPAAADNALCEAATDGDCVAVCQEAGGETCAGYGSECREGAGTCEGLSANRPLDGSGAKCGRGVGRGVGGCRGGGF